MTGSHLTKFFVGILLAQLGVPAGLMLAYFVSGIFVMEEGITNSFFIGLAMGPAASIFGFLFSVPASLIVGMPLSILLYRLSKLNFTTIFFGSWLIPFAVLLANGSLVDLLNPGFYLIFGFPAICGGIIYWWYLACVDSLSHS